MTETLTPAQQKRRYFVEVRRGLGIILRASVVYFGVSYQDLMPSEITASPAPEYSAPTRTPVATYTR